MSPEQTAPEPEIDSESDDDIAALRTQIELLDEENQRLRKAYADAKRSRYRQTALSLAGVGVVAALGGVLFPGARTVLFALAGTGVFLGVLTYFLAPEQFVAATIGRTVYDTLARNESEIVAELGLREYRIYVPTDTGVRLFVPQHEEHDIPDGKTLEDAFVVTTDTGTRGLALEPTGDGLADEFERSVTGPMGTDATALATQTSDALVEQFELVETATPDVDPADGRVTVAITDSTLGAVDAFDHPVASFLASAFARGLETPVRATVSATPEQQTDYRVTLTWDSDDNTDESSA